MHRSRNQHQLFVVRVFAVPDHVGVSVLSKIAGKKRAVKEEMARLQKTLDMLNYKCWYYETAIPYFSILTIAVPSHVNTISRADGGVK